MSRHLYILWLILVLKSCNFLETPEKQAIDICKNSKIQFSNNDIFQYFGLSSRGLSQESKWIEFANSIAKDNPNLKYKWDARKIEDAEVFLVSFTDETNWGHIWEVSLDQQIVKHVNSNEYLSRKYSLSRLDSDDNFKLVEVKEKVLKKEKKYDYSINKNTVGVVYSFKGFLVNNTDKNLTKADLSGSLNLIFDNKVIKSKELWDSGFKRKITKSTPWKPQEKIEFYIKTKGIEEIYLEYEPEYVIFTLSVSAEDPVGFTFNKSITEIDLKEEWGKLKKTSGTNSENSKQPTHDPTSRTKNSPTLLSKPSNAEAKETTTKAEKISKVNQRALMGSGDTPDSSSQPVSSSAQGGSSQRSDDGRPEGTVDGKSLMGAGTGSGNASSSSGVGVDLAGWTFASHPTIRDNVSTRSGRIVFRITVDDSGKIVQSVPLEYNVSNDVLLYYRQVLNQIKFKKEGEAEASTHSGKITFIIKVD